MNFMTGYTKPVVMACILFPGSSGPLYLITHTHTHTQTHTRTHRHRHTMCVCFRGFTLTSADLSTNKHAHLFRCIVCTQGSIVCTQVYRMYTGQYRMYTGQYRMYTSVSYVHITVPAEGHVHCNLLMQGVTYPTTTLASGHILSLSATPSR